MTVLSIQRVVDGVLTSADTTTLAVTDAAGLPVLLSTVVPPSSAGIYRYDTTYFPPGTFTAVWTFVVSGQQNQVIKRIFTIDAPLASVSGVTLAQIEQGVAKRCGPYWKYPVGTGTPTLVIINRLRSSLDSGDYEEMYILRRGRMRDGSLVMNFDEEDRQRIVATYTPAFGTLEPDNDWAIGPITDEEIEVHYLDPEQELREVVRDGLKRCYFWDTGYIANVTTTTVREIDVTASIPWITRTDQIRNVEWGQTGQMASRLTWWKPIRRGAHVWLRVGGLPLGNLQISALRPHFTFVNGELSFVGPGDDDDILHIDLEYAVRAGHITAWMYCTEKLTSAAAEGLRLPMKLVADAFTQASYAYVHDEPELLQLTWEPSALDLSQIGNLAEVP